jgi:hypothetical protein
MNGVTADTDARKRKGEKKKRKKKREAFQLK